MGFRICIGICLACIALVVAAGAPPSPAHAAGSGISYNEVSRFAMGGAPAPGSYANGSFDADFQAATTKKKGLFAMITNAMNMVKNGFASTYYYYNNMERQDSLQDNTATITIPNKNQVIHLDLNKKTYYIESPSSYKMQTMPPMPQQPQAPQQPLPSPQPGTAKVTVSATTKSLGSINVDGVNADGYQMSFKLVSSNATGSCQNGTFETGLTEYVTAYPEPQLKWPSSAAKIPPMLRPMQNPELSNFRPGCTPTVTARAHIGPTAPSGRLAVWMLTSLAASGMANGQSAGGSAGFIIERGNIKELGAGDASLFAPPADFTQVQPPQ